MPALVLPDLSTFGFRRGAILGMMAGAAGRAVAFVTAAENDEASILDSLDFDA